jgi:parvulin-like peptidyl-prolyl isomerase
MKKANIALIGLVVAGAAGFGYVKYGSSSPQVVLDVAAASKKAPVFVAANSMAVVATVDGYNITEAELVPMMQQGVDRAIVLDRRITQSAIAKTAEKTYDKEAKVLLAANRNDILYQLYLSKRTEALKKEITDSDILSFYNKNVKDEDYKKTSLKIFLTDNAKDGQVFYESLIAASKSKEKNMDVATAKMTYLQKTGDHLLAYQSIPYNLGQVIKKMKAGDILEPIVVREGVLVVYVESIVDSAKPKLDAVKEEIKSLILNERLGVEILSIRKNASIQLKG